MQRMETAMTRNIGTIFYMAPEVIDEHDYTIQCDIYSFAITLCEIFTRKKPYFNRLTKTQFIFEIKKIDNPLRPSINDAVPRFIAALIRR
jgi:mitogen-activated protein kinase kinase kinase 7